jgi:hypothetical protein
MRALILFLLLATASFTQQGKADETSSVYSALVEIQTVDSVYSYPVAKQDPYQMDLGDRRVGGYSQRRSRFGWINLRDTPNNRIEKAGKATEASTSSTTTKSGLKITTYTGPELGPNELPYVDAEGNQLKNYGIMLTAEWCSWCPKMYRNTVEPLRREGYKIYVIDVDTFPDIKDRIYRLDTTAEKMGLGVPYFVVREDGKTKKIIYGYALSGLIRPHLKKFAEQENDPL